MVGMVLVTPVDEKSVWCLGMSWSLLRWGPQKLDSSSLQLVYSRIVNPRRDEHIPWDVIFL